MSHGVDKIHLTVSSTDGTYKHPFETSETLGGVVTDTVQHLKLVLPTGNQWVIEYRGTELDQSRTLAQAGIPDEATLLLRARTSGGGRGPRARRRGL